MSIMFGDSRSVVAGPPVISGLLGKVTAEQLKDAEALLVNFFLTTLVKVPLKKPMINSF